MTFSEKLSLLGCRAVIYVEYVPVDRDTAGLAPDDENRVYMADRLDALRETQRDMLLISFPGDERASGGCLAAGGDFSISMPGAGRNRVPSPPIRTPVCRM